MLYQPTIHYQRYILASAILLIFSINPSSASAKDLYTAGFEHSTTSDENDLDTYTLSYINNRRDHFWPYVNDADSDFDWGVLLHRYTGQAAGGNDFNGLQFEGILGWHYSQAAYFSTYLGSHRLDVPNEAHTVERFSYQIDALFNVTPKIKLNLHTANDFVYQYGLQPGGSNRFLYAQQWQGFLEWTPIPKIRINFSDSSWSLSDENTRHEYQVNLLYGISPSWPWIWVGLNYDHLGYDETKPDYWSPNEFYSYGLVLDSSFPITENFTGAIAGSLSRINEDLNPEGNGNSVFLGIDYKMTKSQTLRFGASRILSVQNNSAWSENIFRVSFNGAFE